MTDYIDSYYAQTLADGISYPALAADYDADVCVIGAGLAGLNTALEIALTGKSVVVLEANRVGWGASGRNGGFVIPSFSLGAPSLAKKVGLPHAQKLFGLVDDAMQTIKARITDYAIPGISPVYGMMKLALREDNAGQQDYCDYMKKNFGQNVEYWNPARVREILDTTRYHDGALYQDSFHFHSLNYARGIALQAVRRGARIHENSRVSKVETIGAQHIVRTPSGSIRAKDIVYACSAYIDGLYMPLSNAVVPVATYVISTEPLGERLKDVIRVPYAFLDNRFANDYYRPLPDTRILWGGRVSVYQPSNEKIAGMMRKDMLQVFPQLADVKIESAWGCYMGYPRHKMPQIGQHKPGIWYCTGFGGYGMMATTIGGRVMAEALAGKTQNIDLFKPFGLAFTGGRLIAPAVTQIAYWGYQTMDWIRAKKFSS